MGSEWSMLKRNGRALLACAAALAIGMHPRSAGAIVVLEKGSERAVMGYLVRETEQAIVVRQEMAEGATREVTIPRSQVDEVIVTVAPERLEALNPSRPETYREYAEELAEKRRDPEARDTARRLFAVAALRGDAALVRSSLLGLASLARDAADERRLRALAYLHDPRHDEAVLTETSTSSASSTADGSAELATALRLIRQGKAAAAKPLFEQPAVQKRLAAAGAPITRDELTSLMATPFQGLPPEPWLARLLAAELALEAGQRTVSGGSGDRWSLDDPSLRATVPSLKLERLTEFDPAEVVFRGGKWGRE